MNETKQAEPFDSSSSRASAKRALFIFVPTLLVWFPLITLLQAWTLMLLWLWFIVPQFGVTPLPLPIAIGLDITFGFITSRQNQLQAHTESKKEKQMELSWPERLRKAFIPSFGIALFRVAFTVAFGAIVHLFVRH